MLLTCPNCRTKYRIDESNLDPEGNRFKCSRCGYIFTASPQDGEAEVENEQLIETREIDVSTGQASGENAFYSFEKKRNFKKLILFVVPILVLVGIGITGYLFYPELKVLNPLMKENSAQVVQKNTSENSQVQKIALQNVRQYIVKNKKIGQILVVEGSAKNNFPKPKKNIRLRAQLFSKDGTVTREKTFLCGHTLSLFKLQILSKEKMLENFSKEGSEVVPSGKEAKFMSVFYNPSEKLAEFSLQVVGAENVK